MLKPAYVFDGRLILDHQSLMDIGFHVETIGKRLTRANVLRTVAATNWSSCNDFISIVS